MSVQKKTTKIDIVTVCRNAETTIRSTMESVLNQTYEHLEYYIIDGLSEDNTLHIAKEYSTDKRVHIISDKDSGIYNAMNKALEYVHGDYVIFLNSGDSFYDNHVLEDIAPYLVHDIVYGDVFRNDSNGGHVQRYKGGKWEILVLLLCGTVMCHQAIFTKNSIMKSYRFDEIYAVAADHEFIARALRDDRDIFHINRIVCVYDNENGVSARAENQDWIRKEVDNSLKSTLPGWYYAIKIPKGVYRVIKKLLLNFAA